MCRTWAARLCLVASSLAPILSRAEEERKGSFCAAAYQAAAKAADAIQVWNWLRSRPSTLWNWTFLSKKISGPDGDEITKILARLHRNPTYYAQQKKFNRTEALAIAIFAESRKPDTGRDIYEIIRSGSINEKRALQKALNMIRNPDKLNDRTLGHYVTALQDIVNPYPVDMSALLRRGIVSDDITWHATKDLVAEIGYKRAFLEMGLGRWVSPSTTRVIWEDTKKAFPKILLTASNAVSLRYGNFLVYAPRLRLVRKKLLEIFPKYYDRIAIEGLEKVMPEIQKEIGTIAGLPTDVLDAYYNHIARAFNVATYTYILTVLIPEAIPKIQDEVRTARAQEEKAREEASERNKKVVDQQKDFLSSFGTVDEFMKKRLSELEVEILKTSPKGSAEYLRRMNIAAEQLLAIKKRGDERRAALEKARIEGENAQPANEPAPKP